MADTRVVKIRRGQSEPELEEVALLLQQGALVSFPTETAFALGVNAENIESVKKILKLRGGSGLNRLSLHLPAVENIKDFVKEISDDARKLIDKFVPGPLLMLFEKAHHIPEIITAGSRKISIRVPHNCTASLLLRKVSAPVVATSAGISGRLSLTSCDQVMEELGGKIDIIITSQDDEVLGIEPTIIDTTTRPFRIIHSGFITQAEISQVLGYVPMLSDDDTFPKDDRLCLDMKIILVEGETEKVLRRIKTLMNNLPPESFVGLLLTEASAAYIGTTPYTKVMGPRNDLELIAKNLSANLKAFEKEGTKIVLVEGLPREGIGWAIMERLERVANEILKVE